ncbi:flagellar basal body P-ring formation chaperone FlgA [Paraburkholderia sp. PREW-6R]|uniref:flagellar basal body P-ring formation chaperone FlgA n=1 Tax=Paraburkholderia sp. PREW-6R TaxID=3141544 RepID=UPI0031F546C0
MNQLTYDPTHHAHRAAAQRMGVAGARRQPGLLMRLFASMTLWVAGGIVLVPVATRAQEAGSGPIVIPGPAEQNPAALAALAEHMQAAPTQRAGSAATLAAATAQSLTPGSSARDADAFTRAANGSGSIVIPGTAEPAAAPQMIRTSFKPDANGVVTLPAPGAAHPNAYGAQAVARVNIVPGSRDVVPVVVAPASPQNGARPAAGVQPVAANAPMSASAGFDTLASRGEPPQLGANGKPIVTRAALAPNSTVATVTPVPSAVGRMAAPRQLAPTAAQAVGQPGVQPVAQTVAQPVTRAVAQPVARAVAGTPSAPLPGQQDPEAIRSVALAFLQQQSTGLPGTVEISVAAAFPRGLAACTGLVPFMPSGARLWGRTTVGVRCAGEHPWTIYLQARISLHATYYLAARAMAPGEVLSAADLVARDGDLAGLPQAIVTDPSQAIGSVTLTRVAGGMPLRRDMLRSASAVSIGQTVRVVAAGEGFAISAEGSAMNNASPGQQVRVKTANGQIISGIVKDGATVEIQL